MVRAGWLLDRRRRLGRLPILVRHRPLADPPWMKLLTLPRLGYSNAAVGKEVGFSLVRKSPFSSWTRGASITPTGAKEHQCS